MLSLTNNKIQTHPILGNPYILYWELDKESKLVYQNLSRVKLTSSSLDDVLNDGWKTLIHPDDLEYLESLIQECLKNKTAFEVEYRLQVSPNEYCWILDFGSPKFTDNYFDGIHFCGIDITSRKKDESMILESESRLNEISSIIGEAIIVTDERGTISYTNPAFEKMLGWKNYEILGNTIYDVLIRKDERSVELLNNVSLLSSQNVGNRIDSYLKHKNGEYIPVSFVVSGIKREGKFAGYVIAFHDIIERLNFEAKVKKHIEEIEYNKELVEENAKEVALLNVKLYESEAKLKKLNESKDKFFSIIAHDLKNPFISLLGFAEILVNDQDELTREEIKEYSEILYKSSKGLLSLLENLLEWARLQLGRLDVTPKKFDLNEIINETVNVLEVSAINKSIKLISEINEPLSVYADPNMIKTVVRNLISNAIKFTDCNGSIVISYLRNNDYIQISVSDNGVGIDSRTIKKLFKINENVTTIGTKEEKGTGLGLILCKEYVEKNGGTIGVESTLGKGTTFYFKIPSA